MERLRRILRGLGHQALFITPVVLIWFVFDRMVDYSPGHTAQPWAQEEIPGFTLPQVQPDVAPDAATQRTLAEFVGRPLVVNFSASWCTICSDEKPYLDTLWHDKRRLRLQMISIAVNDDWTAVVNTGRTDSEHYPVLLDADGSVARSWNVTEVPQTLVVDPRGRVLYRFRGAVKATQVDELRRMLSTDVMAAHGLAF